MSGYLNNKNSASSMPLPENKKLPYRMKKIKGETAPNSYFIVDEMMTVSCSKSRAKRSLEEISERKQLENNLKANILEGIITISSSRTYFLFPCLTIIFGSYQ